LHCIKIKISAAYTFILTKLAKTLQMYNIHAPFFSFTS